MNKELRQKIYNKYNGHCAYCGRYIEYKDMQVDHLLPRNGSHYIEKDALNPYIRGYYGIGDMNIKNINDLVNLMPACRRCNHYKRSEPLPIFRRMLQTVHDRLNQIYIFKVAVDYDIVEIKEWDGRFYFEKWRDNGI